MANALLLAIIAITLVLPLRFARSRRPTTGLRRLMLSYAAATAIWAWLIARYYVELALTP
ncbi:MAG: hypothetical protein ACLQVI_28570 [Polyangiaceae bacterium]